MKLLQPAIAFMLLLLLCNCSNNSDVNEMPIFDENESLLVTEPWEHYSIRELSAKEQKTYSKITKAFYEQVFKQKGVLDDSSFCGQYEPRKITIDSIKPFYDFGTYKGAYVVTFIINGFYNRDYRYYVSFSEDYSAISLKKEKESSYGEIRSLNT